MRAWAGRSFRSYGRSRSYCPRTQSHRGTFGAGGLSIGDGAILAWVEVTTLLRLVELRSNGEGRFIPLHAAEHVRTARFLLEPTFRAYVGAFPDQIEPIAAGRNATVAFQRFGGRIPADMQVLARRLRGKIANSVPDGLSFLGGARQGRIEIQGPYYESPGPLLWDTIHFRLKDARHYIVAQFFGFLDNERIFLGSKELRNVLDNERSGHRILHQSEVMLPQLVHADMILLHDLGCRHLTQR